MSPLLIALLVAGGIAVLLAIGYINHTIERARVQRARATAELKARLRLLNQASSQLPETFVPAELRSQLQLIEINLLDKLLRLDSKNEALRKQRDALGNGTANEDSRPAVLQVTSEEHSRSIRQQLESLDKTLQQAGADSIIAAAELQRWQKHLRQCLLLTQLETFSALARQAMQQGKPRVAKLQYERAVAFLVKLNSPALADKISEFKTLMARAEQAANAAEQKNTSGELLSGMEELEKENENWKKKSLYDE